MPKPVERRKDERGEGAEVWSDDDRRAILKIGGLFEKYANRKGKKQEKKPDNKSFLEELGITL